MAQRELVARNDFNFSFIKDLFTLRIADCSPLTAPDVVMTIVLIVFVIFSLGCPGGAILHLPTRNAEDLSFLFRGPSF